jgi:hypothetical protein
MGVTCSCSVGSGTTGIDPGLPFFDRVLLLEQKAETSAGVSVDDLIGDGLPDIVLGKGRHWPVVQQRAIERRHGGFIASNLGTESDRTYSAALADIDATATWTSWSAPMLPMASGSTRNQPRSNSL